MLSKKFDFTSKKKNRRRIWTLLVLLGPPPPGSPWNTNQHVRLQRSGRLMVLKDGVPFADGYVIHDDNKKEESKPIN